MKQKILLGVVLISMLISTATYANWLKDIFDAINKQGGITNYWLDSINSQQRALLASQQDIENLMDQVNKGLTSHSGWGTYQSHDYQSYGEGSNTWSDVMNMINEGHVGKGSLNQSINSLANQFPIDNMLFNKGVADAVNQKFYAVQSKTVLAIRAASQLEYDKIHEQIAYQRMLQQQIENTRDLKSAVDLNNRIQIESNLISLEILRQSAIANQQRSIADQATINGALSNAKFLTK